MNIGERLLKLRKEKGLSQEEVANILGVSRQTISKWETGESNPDFDKIIPLCELYNISTDELIKGSTGEKKEIKEEILDEKISDNELEAKKPNKMFTNEYKKYEPLVVSVSVFLYFISVVWIIFIESLNVISDELMISIFMIIVAIPTCILIYYYLSVGNHRHYLKEQMKLEKIDEEVIEKQKKYKDLDDIIALVFVILYLYISFSTGGWYITWILWVVYSLVLKIIHLILNAKGANKDGE